MRRLSPFAALLLASCGPGGDADQAVAREPTVAATTAAPSNAIEATLKEIFQPYQAGPHTYPLDSDWDRPVYSASLRALIERWKQGFSEGEVAELQDFGWFCECQDWDPAKFTVEVLPHSVPQDGQVETTVRIDLGWNEIRNMRFELVDEGGHWMIDDVHAGSFDGGLRASLERAIAAGVS